MHKVRSTYLIIYVNELLLEELILGDNDVIEISCSPLSMLFRSTCCSSSRDIICGAVISGSLMASECVGHWAKKIIEATLILGGGGEGTIVTYFFN